MTNFENIKKMNEQELSEYINAVYLAGIYVGKHPEEKQELVPYKKWLKKEVEE